MTLASVDGFGERVRHYRLARGVTQTDLAATVGRSHSMLSAIEAGRRQIHVDELVTFANALNVPPTALLGMTEHDRFAEGYQAGYAAAIERAQAALAAVPSAPEERDS